MNLDLSALHADSYVLELEDVPVGYSGGLRFGPFALSSTAHIFVDRLRRQCPGDYGYAVTGMVSALSAMGEMRVQEHAVTIPTGLCGIGGCTFLAGHESEHSWGGAA